MNRGTIISLLFALSGHLWSCKSDHPDVPQISSDQLNETDSTKSDHIALPGCFEEGDVQALIEIPAGTIEKWELNKSTGKIQHEIVDGKPRIVNYLGYPGNYGLIPGTLLSKEKGGDGDPLDVLVLGPPAQRGQLLECKIIGVLNLLDGGEQDDKLIAVSPDSPLCGLNNIHELRNRYPGVTEIIQLWFTNYKGKGKMEHQGFGDTDEALWLLDAAIQEYQINKKPFSKD